MGEDQTNRANEGKLLVTLPAIAFRSFSNKDLGSALNRFYFVVGNCGGGAVRLLAVGVQYLGV